MKILKIQPEERADGTLPFPFFIDEKSYVSKQQFWKGAPYMLIGFNSKPINGYDPKSIDTKEFFKDPKKAIGMYPIFAHKEEKGMEWYTYKDPIERVEILESD